MPRPRPPFPALETRATRRVALGGALAATLGLTACRGDSGPSSGPTGPASGTASGAATDSPTGAADNPDQAVLDKARAETAALLALTTRARRTPAAAAALTGLAETHRAHLAALEGHRHAVPPGRLPGRALATVRRREAAAQRRYAAWALEARSGALARLLASMSAGIAAHLAALDLAGTPTGGQG